MTRRKHPIGIQEFRTIRERSCDDVDKTILIRELYGKPAPMAARFRSGMSTGAFP